MQHWSWLRLRLLRILKNRKFGPLPLALDFSFAFAFPRRVQIWSKIGAWSQHPGFRVSLLTSLKSETKQLCATDKSATITPGCAEIVLTFTLELFHCQFGFIASFSLTHIFVRALFRWCFPLDADRWKFAEFSTMKFSIYVTVVLLLAGKTTFMSLVLCCTFSHFLWDQTKNKQRSRVCFDNYFCRSMLCSTTMQEVGWNNRRHDRRLQVQ